jgi:hypothetical protein
VVQSNAFHLLHMWDRSNTAVTQPTLRSRSQSEPGRSAKSTFRHAQSSYPTCQAGATCYTQSQQTRRSLATGITGLRTTIDNGGCRSLSLQKSVYSESRVPRAKNPSRSTPQISNENNESRRRIEGKSPTTSPPPNTSIHSPLLRGTAPPLQPPTS